MPNIATRIRQRVGRVLLAPQLAQIQRSFAQMQEAYFQGPFQLPPQQLAKRLVSGVSEYDSELLYSMLEQMRYELIGAVGFGIDTSGERERAVRESRRVWRYDVLGQWMVNQWTNYGFGENIEVAPMATEPASGETNEEGEQIPLAREVFNEFWLAPRNAPVLRQDRIHRESNNTLVDGQRFWAYFSSSVDGLSTLRSLNPDEFKEIVTSPTDDMVPWFYKRVFIPRTRRGQLAATSRTLYYPDWQLFFREKETDITVDEAAKLLGIKPEERADLQGINGVSLEQDAVSTWVCMQHVAHNQKDERSLWGWPLLAPAAAPWLKAHREFRQDRAAVASTAAMFAQKLKHKGGSRAGATFRAAMQSTLTQPDNYLETNPPPVAGSTFIENDAVSLEKLHGIGTAASDAKADGESLAWVALLGGGVFPHFAGIDAHLFTREEMSAPLLRQWSRYQLFWSAQFRVMVEIVLRFHKMGTADSVTFDTYDAEVSTDSLVETDLEQVTVAAQRYLNMLGALQNAGLVSDQSVTLSAAAVSRVILQGFGVIDANEIASDEAMEPESVEEEPSPSGKTQEAEIAALAKQNAIDGNVEMLDLLQFAVGQVMEEGE